MQKTLKDMIVQNLKKQELVEKQNVDNLNKKESLQDLLGDVIDQKVKKKKMTA